MSKILSDAQVTPVVKGFSLAEQPLWRTGVDKTQREIKKSYTCERFCKLFSNCFRCFALGFVVFHKAALKLVGCECILFSRLYNKTEGWLNRKAPVDHIYTSTSQFTSTNGYTLDFNQE